MKCFYTLCVLVVISSGLSVQAQQTFSSKRKSSVGAATPSFQARQINGNKHAGARSSASIVRGVGNFVLRKDNGPHRILQTDQNNLPSFIETSRDASSSRSAVRKDAITGSTEYLKDLTGVLGLKDASTEFIAQRVQTDGQNRFHVRMNQFYNNVPVHGAEVIVHLNEFGEGVAFNGKYLKLNENFDVNASITSQAALERVKSDAAVKFRTHGLNENEKHFVQYDEPQSILCIYESKGITSIPVLAYHIVFCPSVSKRLEYFVDAHTGNVLYSANTVCFVDGPKTASANDLNGVSRTINTYQKGATFFLLDVTRSMFDGPASVLPDEPVGGILTIDMNNTFGDNTSVKHVTTSNNVWANTKAVSAHFNAGAAFEYYKTQHSRNSIDGAGGTVFSIINVPDSETGAAMDNAFWNGKFMCYGNGDVAFKPLAGAMDVAGHEMTHGVVQNTANLEYQGESGAINESMADVFGFLMDPTDYLIGEDVVKASAFPSGALRSLSDPHNGGTSLSDAGFQPKHMNEKYSGTEDNGGVHINSGIPNHAFFKYAEATTKDKAAKVYYKALNDYLTKSSQFIDLRLAVIKAATDLFGAGSNEVTQAGLAFDAVGIGNGEGGNFNETLPANPGTEFMLVTINPVVSVALVRIQVNNQAEASMSSTKHISRPSVTDDGTAAIFVAEDHTIHALLMEPGQNPSEVVVQDDPMWSNAVISKGGSRIAAVTGDENDNTIYVFDLISDQVGQFELYNPTYTEGVSSAGPRYADALEWDYSGEFLVYDAFNVLENSGGSDIEYWDVNFIHVWDQASQDFSDGTIEKLFASLPEGVSIGNPSFAKNSPSIIAFDYIDETTGDYAILGCNAETNEVNIIFENNFLGYPTFNKSDNRVSFTSGDGAGGTQTGYVTLNSDKISSNGVYNGLYADTKWPVYFSVGEREIGDQVITGIHDEYPKISLTCYPNPFTDEISMAFSQPAALNGRVDVYNLVGQKVFDFKSDHVADDVLSIKAVKLPPGQYVIRYQNGTTTVGCKAIKR